MRRIDTRSVWLQQRLREGGVELLKIRGEVNPADLFTKHLASEERVRSLCGLFGCRFVEGRAEGAPEFRRVGKEGQVLAVQTQGVSGAKVLRDCHVYPSVVEDAELIPEAYLHHERVLPHRLAGDIAKMFPRALPAEEAVEDEETEEWLEAGAAKLREDGGTGTC